ncbi:MAG: hypothetical protein LBO66_05970 [Deltaproteobacteria bacterium]|jgi:hypothetical protein|nr:hypothetical protein [Deltaproteobacteria bacterium]
MEAKFARKTANIVLRTRSYDMSVDEISAKLKLSLTEVATILDDDAANK